MTVATASYVTGSVYNSSNPALSASYATTTSFASNANQLNGQVASYYQNASNINAGTLNNSYLPTAINVTSVTASFTGSLTGALIGTASWANNAVTASYVTGSVHTSTNPALSASYAATASFASTVDTSYTLRLIALGI